MSQWNNSYAYNNQYQPNGWNSDLNGQFINQPYYPNQQFNASNQYVSFDEFLSQMQTNEPTTGNTSNYGNVQFQNYPVNQYNFQNVPPTSQRQLGSYNYGPNSQIPNEAESYQTQNPFNTSLSVSGPSEIVMKSNLTPTATEFVPKCSMVIPSTSTQNISLPESIANNRSQEPTTFSENKTVQSKSSETNWRERPQTQQKSSRNETRNKYESENTNNRNSFNQDAYTKWESSNQDISSQDYTNYLNSDDYTQNASNSNNQNMRESYIKDNNSDKQVSSKCYQESSRHNQECNSQNKYNDNDYNQGSSSQSSTGNSETRDRDKYKNSSNQNRIYNRNSGHWDPDSYNQESSSSQSNNRNDKNQSKPNSKSKNKDSERTFYNSSINKSQDVRNGKGDTTNRRTFTGTARFRGTERNSAEEEQYAKGYSSYGKEKSKIDYASSPIKAKNKHKEVPITELTQRDRLSEQLDKGTLECLVCCERVKQIDSVWSCSNCYHVLHLICIKKWALSSVIESKWRCPACQNINDKIPTEYRCMCGAIRSPEYQRGYIIAHTCGKSCKRSRSCPHHCTLLCHPGPCPPCQATVNKECGCGKEKRSVLCSSKLVQVCGQTCGRTLNCGVHKCVKECHEGPCESCTETVTQVCYCPLAKKRSVLCTLETASCANWSCVAACSRVLACGAHVCPRGCHAPPCEPCRLLPDAVRTCPCGKTKIGKDQRKSCTDPIPLCNDVCGMTLTCGPVSDHHICKQNCHEGPCPPCPEKTVLQCRCGRTSRKVPCTDLPEMANNIQCQKKCNKKLPCGRHHCRATCCALSVHRCTVLCWRKLSCQLHHCEEFCHTGHCAPCPRVSFEELSCACGSQVIMPPVPCGVRPPACTAPCPRPRACGHSPHHSCHTGDCPPCVVLTTKTCYGQHEERKTILCSQKEFSCGLPCSKPLPCGKHTCIKTCHKGPCDTAKCTQPCNEKRPSCGHPCAAPCHSGDNSSGDSSGPSGGAGPSGQCPSSAPCRRLVRATCQCARKHVDRPCNENARDYLKMMSALAAAKIQEGGSVDLSEVQRPGAMLKTLECDDECRMEARTRQLALALQIRNPDVSSKLAPRYSEHVRATATREPAFANQIHDRLTELVQLAKKSKQKTRSHSFPSMNRQKRQFIHELCEHFGCESVAYDAEPNRNVVATADKEKSWLPAMSVLEVLAREAGKRRVPGPVIRTQLNTTPKSTTGGWATLTSTNAWAARSQPKPAQDKPKIDYFDNPPDN